MNNGVNALPIIGSFYIKESKLLEMTSYAFTGSNATSVNIYIDLNSVFNKLFTPSFTISPDIKLFISSIKNILPSEALFAVGS